MCKADNTGDFWVDWGNGHLTCLSADLKSVIKDLDLGTDNFQRFAVDTTKDSVVYDDSFLDKDGLWKGRMMRHRISTGEKFVLQTYPEVIGCGGIEIDPTHGQVIADIHLNSGYYLAQIGKKDGQWGELHRTSLTDAASDNWNGMVRGSSFSECYVYSTGVSLAKRFRYQ